MVTPENSGQPSLGEINRRLIRIEDRMDKSFVGAEVYQAEKSAAIEARQALEARLSERTASLESTVTWAIRIVLGAFVTGGMTFLFYALR